MLEQQVSVPIRVTIINFTEDPEPAPPSFWEREWRGYELYHFPPDSSALNGKVNGVLARAEQLGRIVRTDPTLTVSAPIDVPVPWAAPWEMERAEDAAQSAEIRQLIAETRARVTYGPA